MSPERYSLRGTDYFQAVIDFHNRKKGGQGHIVRLLLHLKGELEREVLLRCLEDNDLFCQIAGVRLSDKIRKGYPNFCVTSTENKELPVSFHQIMHKDELKPFFQEAVPIFEGPPLLLRVIYSQKGDTFLLFAFHHIFFDFQGVQALIASLNGDFSIPLLSPVPPKSTFREKARGFFRSSGIAFRGGNFNMWSIPVPLPDRTEHPIVFRELVFEVSETQRVLQQCRGMGAAYNKSAYLLAGVATALYQQFFRESGKKKFFWVPVPVNTRRRGSKGGVLLNNLSFLFLKIEGDDLDSFEETLNSIKRSMKRQISAKSPKHFINFLEGYLPIPLPIYNAMFNLPSLGELSTFSFSYLGNTFAGLDTFLGHEVIDVKNYPSNSIVPGLTVIFYEFRGQLRLMSSWVEGWFSEEEQQDLLFKIKRMLLNGGEK